jgi:TonB family protein
MYNRQTSTLISLGLHIAAVALILTVTVNPGGVLPKRLLSSQEAILIAPYMPHATPEKAGGGGGGGERSVLRASPGALPKIAPRQFTPPRVITENEQPKLMVEPTIVVLPNAPLPKINMAQLGDPTALAGPPSSGTGSGGGIGNKGKGGGVGDGDGVGFGPGKGYNTGGGDPSPGGNAGPRGSVVPAALIWKVEPEYSDEARRAKVQGTVLLYLEVDSEGRPRNISVRQSLGLGLDDKAIEAVMHWKFRPGRQNGKAITTSAVVEVNFRLL